MHRYIRERELDPPDLVPAAEPDEPEENPPLNLSPAELMMPRYLNCRHRLKRSSIYRFIALNFCPKHHDELIFLFAIEILNGCVSAARCVDPYFIE